MAKKLYSVALRFVQIFIRNNKVEIANIIKNRQKYEYAKVLGRSHYEIYIQRFIEEFKIDKDIDYALKVLNHYKSYKFIYKLYQLLNLDRFEEEKDDENAKKDHRKSIFFTFVYYLNSMHDHTKEDLENRLFKHYFLHMLALDKSNNIELNFKNLSFSLIKGREITINESFSVVDEKAVFKLLLNKNVHIELSGNSIKTLRKRAYKQLFYDLIDNKVL